MLVQQSISQGRKSSRRRGVTIVLLVILLPVVLSISAYAINLSYMEMARTELQISTDVATRAAGRTFLVTGSQSEAQAAADRLFAANPFANQRMTLKGVNLEYGVSTRDSESDRFNFVEGKNPNAVRIAVNGNVEVPMLFPTFGVRIPFRPIKTAISTQNVLDIALVLDRSGSMAFSSWEIANNNPPASAPPGWKFGDAAPPNARWLDASDAANRFLSLLTQSELDERVGLVTYSDKSRVEIKLSSSYVDIQKSIFDNTQKFDGGATNIGDGILDGANILSDKKNARSWASRIMVVLTDGIHNTGVDPITAAYIAAGQKIQIFTVTFSTEADISKMQEVAEIGAGKHFHASTGAELTEAFEKIVHSLPTLITY